MTRRVLSTVVTIALAAALMTPPGALGQGQRVDFSLGAGQMVTVGAYVLRFNGVSDGAPAYDLYSPAGALVTSFSASPAGSYEYQDVSLVTTILSPDGMTATGTVTLR